MLLGIDNTHPSLGLLTMVLSESSLSLSKGSYLEGKKI